MVRMDADKIVKRVEERGGKKHQGCKKREKRTAKIEGLREVGYEKIGGKMKDGEGVADRRYGKKQQKE